MHMPRKKAVKKQVKKIKEPLEKTKMRKILKKRKWPLDEINEALDELWPPEPLI